LVPENCYAREKVEQLRFSVVGALSAYIKGPRNAEFWNCVKRYLADYLKPVTGALRAAATTQAHFQVIAEMNGYKPGWAYFQMQQKKNQHVRN
jgi:hypothetical protein